MHLFRLDASIVSDGSRSRALADLVEAEFTAAHRGATITRRHVGIEPIAADVWANAVAGSRTPVGARTPQQQRPSMPRPKPRMSSSRPTALCSPSRCTTSGRVST